jgi:iron complex transport system substrate-binding protein
MRIASLVPSATEALFALGFGAQVVAVTHECDHPAEASRLPRLTRSMLPPGLEPDEVDARVREITGRGEALYKLDEPALAGLEPDLIVTQALCAVCAVSYDDVRAVAERLDSRPEVISLDPKRLQQVLDDLVRLADACGDRERGVQLRADLNARLGALRELVRGAERPRVLALEWLDPPYVGGHWVPDMIDVAGGAGVLGEPGVDSRTVAWKELAEVEADVVVAMPCGLYVDEAAEQALSRWDRIEELGAARLVAVDAAGSFSRPGPRLVDGAELLGHLLHPARVGEPDGLAWRELAPAPGPAPL